MAVTYRTIQRTYTDPSGNPVVDDYHPTFDLSWEVGDGTTASIFPIHAVCSINALGQLVGPNGAVGLSLACNDTLTPANSFYTVSGEPTSASWAFRLLSTMTSPVDLASLSPTTPGPPTYTMSLSSPDSSINVAGTQVNPTVKVASVNGGSA